MKTYLIATAAAFSAVTLGSVVFVAKAEPNAVNVASETAKEFGEYVCRAFDNGATTKEEVMEQAGWNYFMDNAPQAPLVAKIMLKDSARRESREAAIQSATQVVKAECPGVYNLPYASANPIIYLD
jgi:hypothetical protein